MLGFFFSLLPIYNLTFSKANSLPYSYLLDMLDLDSYVELNPSLYIQFAEEKLDIIVIWFFQ